MSSLKLYLTILCIGLIVEKARGKGGSSSSYNTGTTNSTTDHHDDGWHGYSETEYYSKLSIMIGILVFMLIAILTLWIRQEINRRKSK